MTTSASLALLSLALAALPAAPQQAPPPQAQPAPAQPPLVAPDALQDPTQADAQLLRALGNSAGGSRNKTSSILVALRGLVVAADGHGIAVLETGDRLVRVTVGQELTLDTAAQHRVRVKSLDATGVVLQDVITGQLERFD